MKWLLYFFVAAVVFCLGWFTSPGQKEKRGQIYDTITSTYTVRNVKVDTQYIIRPLPYIVWIDSSDTVHASDTCWHPREYREYKDSNYYAKVSGIDPRLEELRFYPKTVYETKYVYRDVVGKPKRWGLGLSAGYGVGRNGLSPVIAVTVNYNLWQF